MKYAIIVAGGKGLRMGNDIPKQFLLLYGKPILMRSLETFYNFDSSIECIVVLPKEQISYWRELCENYCCKIPHRVIEGGIERYHSVCNGLQIIEKEGIVAVHDGVRPLLTHKMLQKGYEMAEKYSSAIPFIDSVDSLRVINSKGTNVLDRKQIKRIQTPQFFDVKQLKQAMETEYQPQFTDEATVWEYSGRKLSFFEGDTNNIKITTPIDLKIAETLLIKK